MQTKRELQSEATFATPQCRSSIIIARVTQIMQDHRSDQDMTASALRCFILLIGLVAQFAATAAEPALLSGQTIYLPVYSHVYHGDLGADGKPRETLVSTHVSVRNTDPQTSIRLVSARYYDTKGKQVRSYVNTQVTIPPLSTYELFVPRTDTGGGSGANFLIVWTAETPANPPIVEALHADIREARTLMFVTTGQAIKTR